MEHIIDWTSIKLIGISTFLFVIGRTEVLAVLSAIAFVTTIVYNGIRIYKELKKKK